MPVAISHIPQLPKGNDDREVQDFIAKGFTDSHIPQLPKGNDDPVSKTHSQIRWTSHTPQLPKGTDDPSSFPRAESIRATPTPPNCRKALMTSSGE